MIRVRLEHPADFDGWRNAARKLAAASIAPEHILWEAQDSISGLFSEQATNISDIPEPRDVDLNVPKSFIEISRRVVCHSAPFRFDLLYRLLCLLQSKPDALHMASDPDIIRLTQLDKAVRRDQHKMHAFVRFRKTGQTRYYREQFAAWFEPDHFITELAAPFFMRRFPNMDWVIVTPHRTAIWDGRDLKFTSGGRREDVPAEDAVEDQWSAYFVSIFNPARLKVKAMQAEMPKKYWKNLPEAELIPQLIQSAKHREAEMIAREGSAPHPRAGKLLGQSQKT